MTPAASALPSRGRSCGTRLQRVSVPAGLTKAHWLLAGENPVLESIDLGSLTELGELSIDANPSLTQIDVGALTRVSSLQITDNPLFSPGVFDDRADLHAKDPRQRGVTSVRSTTAPVPKRGAVVCRSPATDAPHRRCSSGARRELSRDIRQKRDAGVAAARETSGADQICCNE